MNDINSEQDKPKIRRLVQTRIPTAYGDFNLILYDNSRDNKEHLALVMGDIEAVNAPLVRMHSECFTGDVIGSLRCDCGEQLSLAMQKIAEEGVGAILYLRQEGRGIGLLDKLQAYNLQDEGYDTVDANVVLGHAPDERDYAFGMLMLEDLGISTIRLMTNNPRKIEALTQLGIEVHERVPLQPYAHPENTQYLLTKAQRMDHMLNVAPLMGEFNGNRVTQIQSSNGNGEL